MIDPIDTRVSAGAYPPGQAPRLTVQDIKDSIANTEYAVFGGKLTVCVLTLKNGTLITGESSCVYVENFDAELGQKIAFDRAMNKIWSLEGYLLAQRKLEDDLRFAGN